ncbi:hypothetical protein DFH29DRAFT_888078, partial [Suillus ampliporus]
RAVLGVIAGAVAWRTSCVPGCTRCSRFHLLCSMSSSHGHDSRTDGKTHWIYFMRTMMYLLVPGFVNTSPSPNSTRCATTYSQSGLWAVLMVSIRRAPNSCISTMRRTLTRRAARSITSCK